MPAVPGPPVAVTNTPSRSPVAGRTANTTSVDTPMSWKWSSGTSIVTQVKSESGQGSPPSCSSRSSVVGEGVVVGVGSAVDVAGCSTRDVTDGSVLAVHATIDMVSTSGPSTLRKVAGA